MIREDIKALKTGQSDLRKFGLVVGGVFLALGLLFLLRHKARAPYFLAPGAVLFVLGLVLPAALKQIYIGWMAVAIVIGSVISHLILTLFFFVIISPTGLVARCFRKDFLRLRLDRKAASYWIPYERHAAKTPEDYERQF